MPPLEPLSETNSLRDPSPVPPPLPVTSPESAAPLATKEQIHHEMGFVRDLAGPLKFSLILENKGNVARDHLASERTYLAYVRTSLATASAGVGVWFAVHMFRSLTP